MGFIAQYLMVDDRKLKGLAEMENHEFSKAFFHIEENEAFERMDIDSLWDVLHYFLTGVSARTPVEHNRLSEAIAGTHFFDSFDEEADFITYTRNRELPEIIDALQKFDFEQAAEKFRSGTLKKLQPPDLHERDKEQLLDEMKSALHSLVDFYKKALREGRHVIVGIL